MSITELIEWKSFFASLQMHAPRTIWGASMWNALLRPIFLWVLPRSIMGGAKIREKVLELFYVMN